MKMGKFKSTFLNADDITAPTTVTVRDVVEEKVGTEQKAVVYFEEIEQGMALSKTAIGQLEELFGSDDSDDWVGKQAVLYNDRSVMFQGKKVGGLRFRAVRAPATAAG